jgi:hypothetical protein
MAAIIGQTSHYKSGLLHTIERLNASQLLHGPNPGNRVIIHISTEEDIEEQGILELAHFSSEPILNLAHGRVSDWGKLIESAYHNPELPIYRIGLSLKRKGMFGDLSLTNVCREIDWMVETYHIDIASIYLDYLQALPIDSEIRNAALDQQRRLQVRADVYRLKEMSKFYACPLWVAIQAKQKLDFPLSSTFLMPGQYDGEETSSIAQRFDRILTIWMPKQTWPIGKEIFLNKETTFQVEENMFFIRVAKQRNNLPSGRLWLCRIDFTNNTIRPEGQVEQIGFPGNGSI